VARAGGEGGGGGGDGGAGSGDRFLVPCYACGDSVLYDVSWGGTGDTISGTTYVLRAQLHRHPQVEDSFVLPHPPTPTRPTILPQVGRGQ
jgi:hypothetical protein